MSIFSYHLFLATTKNRPKLPPQLLIENHLHTTIALSTAVYGFMTLRLEARDYGMEVISVASTSYSRAFFIEFLLGGQCPKRALQMVKRGSFIYIYIYISIFLSIWLHIDDCISE